MKLKYLLLLAISGTIITLDQSIKVYIHAFFNLHESIEVIPGFFNITYVRNYGAAFGILSDSHPGFRDLFFLSMPPVAMILILVILRGVQDADRLTTLSLSLVFGGAVGNYIDRLRFRYVIDFLDFHIQDKYVYPAFNVADSAIVGGVALLLYIEFTRRPVKKVEPNSVKSAEADLKS